METSAPTGTRTSRNRPSRKLIGELLTAVGHTTREEVADALAEQRQSGRGRIGEILIERGSVDAEAVAESLSVQLNIPYLPPPIEPDPEALSLIPPEIARRLQVLALSCDSNSIRVALADPRNADLVQDLRFRLGKRVDPVVVSTATLQVAMAEAYGKEIDALIRALPGQDVRGLERAKEELEREAHSAPLVRLVDHLLSQAIESRASDIHIEQCQDELYVRFRIDGMMRRVLELPLSTHSSLISRIKIMAGMDIAVKRRPQDGAISFDDRRKNLSLRVSTLPVRGGEKCVLRILDPEEAPPNLDGLGMLPQDLRRLRTLIRAGRGVILAAGPTGSGKTSTLFGAIGELDRETMNITTLEDPTEYELPGVNQVQVDPRSGLGFPATLRSILRQDPDVVMVGEIRDRETAEIAMAAAVTGHLVLSTIHTTDAPGAVTRLLNMGVPAYLVSGGLAGVVSQRLVRTVCPHCRGRDSQGCERCHEGHLGRTGVFQVLIMNDTLREEVIRGASTPVLRRMAEEAGMGSMADDARRKVVEGVTTPHEVARVIQLDPGVAIPCERCGQNVPTDGLACPHCGEERMRVCVCGRRLRKGWRFCPACVRRVVS